MLSGLITCICAASYTLSGMCSEVGASSLNPLGCEDISSNSDI